MNSKFLAMTLTLVLMSDHGHAQTIPDCPSVERARFYRFEVPLREPISSMQTAFLAYSQFVDGFYEFLPENIVISGYQVSFVARGKLRFGGEPLELNPIGLLPAGNYTATIQPIATNVTPPVLCPVLTVPFVVQQAYAEVPVPAPTGILASALAALMALAGLLGLRRRFQRH